MRYQSLKILQRDSHVTHSQFDERHPRWGTIMSQRELQCRIAGIKDKM